MNKSPLLLLLFVSGCGFLGADYDRPALPLPDRWQGTDRLCVVPPPLSGWWQSFGDVKLNALIEEGLAANDDLAMAAARVAEARAQLDLRHAYFFPEIDAEGNVSRTRNSGRARFGGFSSVSKPFNNFGLSAVLNYEINLWGKITYASDAARARLLASEASRDAVRLAVASDIAAGYFNLRMLAAQMVITDNTIRARQAAYDYREKQYRHGAIDALTLRQSESELAATRTQKPPLKQALAEQQTALAFLLGRDPKTMATVSIMPADPAAALPAPPVWPTDLPSTLLNRRPDIQAAEQALIAANAEIGAARADYFPTVSLSSLIGLASSQTSQVLQASARRWQVGGDLSMPLLDFGRTSANVDTAIARKDQALAAYAQTVRLAFKETLDAMYARQTARDSAQAQEALAAASGETLRLADLRYKAGYSSQLEMLDAQRTLYQAQLGLVSAEHAQLIAAVNLFKALGGGWEAPQE